MKHSYDKALAILSIDKFYEYHAGHKVKGGYIQNMFS